MYTNYAWPNAPSGTPVAPNTLTNVNVAGIYTCTATDAGGCTRTSTIEIFDFCSQPFPAFTWELSANTGNDNATDVINNLNLGSSTVTTNDAIYIAGTFTVDQSLSFVNCPNIFLDAYAEIVLLNGATLTIDHSNLTAACKTMWNGIKANHVSESIVISNSTLRDMYWGVDASYGAPLNVQNSTFTDNNVGIRILNSPSGYNTANGNCIVRKNIFNSSGNALLKPMQTQSKGELGVYLERCVEAQIGVLDPVTKEENRFIDLYTGIYTIPISSSTSTQNFYLYNNDFINIKADPFIGFSPQKQIINNCYQTRKGAGIYFDRYPTPINPNFVFPITHTGYVINVIDGAEFNNCDKAVVGHYINAKIENVLTFNTLMGFMFSHAHAMKYEIGDVLNAPGDPTFNGRNYLTGVFIGTQIVGNAAANSYINYNHYILFNGGINTGWCGLTKAWPKAVDIQEFTQPNEQFLISDNTIDIPNIGGTGIVLNNTGKNLNCLLNDISFTTSDPWSHFLEFPNLTGIEVNSANKSILKGNDISGLMMPIGAYNARRAKGIGLGMSTNMHIECNKINNMQYGMWVTGYCGTSNTATQGVVNNVFNNHNHAIFFTYGANEGTLNDIGTSTLDYGNKFLNTNGLKAYVNGYKMYRMAMNWGYSNNIFSNSLPNLHSWSNVGGTSRYKPLLASSVITSCQPPYNIMGSGTSTVDEDFAEDVLNDSLQSFTYPDMAAYMQERELFAQLDADSIALQNNAEFSDFYNAMTDSALGQLYAMDRSLAELNLGDSTVALQQLLLLQSQNTSINTTTFHDANEQAINTIYLDYLQYGWDSLSTDQKTFIEELAKSCIYTHGYGVLKARALWANMEPDLNYDDLYICTECGNNKTDLFAGIKEYINSSTNDTKENAIDQLTQESVLFYPNPATNQLNIRQNIAEEGDISISLMDNLGRTVRAYNSKDNINFTTVALDNLPIGVYTCKVVINKDKVYYGKITIIQQ